MSNINAVAPKEATGEALEFIDALWEAFNENLEAFENGEMPMKDEVKYQVISSPGPRQYKAYSKFFKILEGGKDQIWTKYKKYMYMHDFADVKDGTSEPAILEVMENLYKTNDYNPKEITLVSGLFWGQHLGTRNKIMEKFKKFHARGDKVRILTRAKEEVIGKDNLNLIFSEDSHFDMAKRIPFHYLRAGDDYLYPEFPHTESSVFRLSVLLDIDKLVYKDGKTIEDMKRFLNLLIEKAI